MPRPSGIKQEKRVCSRELEQVLEGEKQHGAGSATPKDREARPSPSLLAQHSVLDGSQDGDYVPGKRASPSRKPRISAGASVARAWETFSALTSLPPSPTATVTTVPASEPSSQQFLHLNRSAQRTSIQSWQRGTSGKLYPLLSPAQSFCSPPGAYPNNTATKHPRLVAQISRVQKMAFVAIAGVIALFALVNVFFGASATYTELDIAARTTAERMEALHPILDDKLESCFVYTSVTLHILIDIMSWAVAHLVSIVTGGTALLIACMVARLCLEA